VCVDGACHCTQAALPLLRQSDAGAMINIGAMTAYTGATHRAHVVTAKAALDGLTRALAHEFAEFGITVNCVSPGLVDTTRTGTSASASPAHHAHAQTLLGRPGRPEESPALLFRSRVRRACRLGARQRRRYLGG
jgi:3-oxoacyl-[acyl-carrier protein] reductase